VFSTFAGTYGGPIAARPVTGQEARQLHEQAGRALRASLFVTLAPGSNTGSPPGFDAEADFTHVVDLEGRTFDEVLGAFHRRRREFVRRGEREGIEVHSRYDSDDVERYAALYAQTLDRWGERASSRYPFAVFERLGDLRARNPEVIRLWWAELAGDRVAGMWAFYWNGHVALWHAATKPVRATSFSPMVSVCAEILRDAIERGCRRVDFNPSGGHAAAVDFKRRLGAREESVQRLRHIPAPRNPLRRLAVRLRARRAEV
jgi:hypothetical protein